MFVERPEYLQRRLLTRRGVDDLEQLVNLVRVGREGSGLGGRGQGWVGVGAGEWVGPIVTQPLERPCGKEGQYTRLGAWGFGFRLLFFRVRAARRRHVDAEARGRHEPVGRICICVPFSRLST